MEIDSRDDPKAHEAATYQTWLDAGCFTPPAQPRPGAQPFTIMIPPPNVTGVLHMGHALNGTLQDIVIRFRRMQGYDALWVPGTDHAGIATQAVVEKKLYAERGLTRNDLGRDAFLAEVWAWKQKHGDMILEQYRRLGASCDWTRTKFTMDEDLSRAVRTAFLRLWEKKLIYRGARLVHWDCVLETAISDDEIEYEERKGKLYYLRYPIEGAAGEHLVVATTRPETMLGDTGVAVHPDDARYGKLVGKHVVLPFLGRRIPIVADDTVDPAFGTGAVKLTPGHDPADYERGARHRLPIVIVIEKDGKMAPTAGPFAGLSREKARDAVVKAMDELGLLEKVEDIKHSVALSDRSKSVIEPLVSEQWFVSMRELAGPAIAAVDDKSLVLRPERWTKVYLDWLHNVQDWCISRQLWWGHRIPIWYDADDLPVGSATDLEIGAPHPISGKPIVRQDPDVLDTWASSWLWPFATLGWPDNTADLRRFYPTQFLSTAREIIYLWVARMIMAGHEFVDTLPPERRTAFSVCYVHATVLDGKGKRMSKSAGNGIDPIDMIEQYGADAVRHSLMMLTREGQDVRLSENRFEEGRRFTNKIWNATRFALARLSPADGAHGFAVAGLRLELEDRWILARLENARREVTEALDQYRFNDAATGLYRFVWNDLCDWYLELVKGRLDDAENPDSAIAARATLARALRDTLALLHPVVPFLTEVLWDKLHQALGVTPPSLLAVAPWPDGTGLATDSEAERQLTLLQDVVRALRNLRALTQSADRAKLDAVLVAPRAEDLDVLRELSPRLVQLGYLGQLSVEAVAARPPQSAAEVCGQVEVFLVLEAGADTARLVETLTKRAEKARIALAGVEKKLGNDGFRANADPELIAAEEARATEYRVELGLLERNLSGLATER